MKKKIICIAICAAMSICTCGCSGNEDTSSGRSAAGAVSSTVSGISAEDIIERAAPETMSEKAYYSDEKFQNNVSKLYGIDTDKLEDGGIAYGSNGSAEELSVLKLKDGASAERIFEARVEYRSTQFENYKPSEMPKIEAAQIFEEGGFWFLIIADDPDSIHQTIDSMMQG